MHIVTGLSKELLPPVGEVEPGDGGKAGGRCSSWSVLPFPVPGSRRWVRSLCCGGTSGRGLAWKERKERENDLLFVTEHL